MTQVTHPILGQIDMAEPGYWQADVTFDGRSVSADLTMDEPGLPSSAVRALPQSLRDLEHLDRAALSAEDYQRSFGVVAPDLANPDPLFACLVLVRVGLYPE